MIIKIQFRKRRVILILFFLILTFIAGFFGQILLYPPEPKGEIFAEEIILINKSEVLGESDTNPDFDLYEIPLVIKTIDEDPVNAVEIYFTFDPKILQVQDIPRESAFIKIWIRDFPKIDNKKGLAEIAGGIPSPGVVGRVELLKMKVFLKKGEDGKLIFTDKTRMLRNDGNGTSVPLVLEDIIIMGNN